MNIFKGVKILFKLTSSFHRLLQKKKITSFSHQKRPWKRNVADVQKREGQWSISSLAEQSLRN